MVSRAVNFFAGTIEYGHIKFGRPPGAELDPDNFDGTAYVENTELKNTADNVLVWNISNGYHRINVGDQGLYSGTGGLTHILRAIAQPGKNLLGPMFHYARALRGYRLQSEGRGSPNISERDIQIGLQYAEKFPEIAVVHANLQALSLIHI